MKESFVFYETWADAIRQIPDNERLQVFDAIMAYGIYGVKTELGGLAQMALNLVFNDIDDCKARRAERKDKARQSANKRWQKNNANACERMQSDANACERMQSDATQCYNVNVNGNGNGNGDVNVNSKRVDADKSATPKKTIEQRKEEFGLKIKESGAVEKYGREMCLKFFNYWTEHGDSDKKMRFEKQKSFDIKLRLATWYERDKQYAIKLDGGERMNRNVDYWDK